MSDLFAMLQAAAGNAGEEVDPYFNQTTLLLHGDGTDGAQNNTFLDSSSNSLSVTRVGNTTQGTFSPFSAPDGRWSNYFDGTSDNLSVANNAAFQFGTGDFTVEAWVYQTVQRSEAQVIAKCAVDNTWATGWVLALGTSNSVVSFWVNGSNVSTSGASTVTLNGWSHVAVSRSGTTLKMFIDGVEVDSDTNSTSIVPTAALTIGADITSSAYEFQGYLSNVRVVKGTALYTTGFTPSTSPLTTTSQGATSSEVELLTCQSNRFVDNSSNAFAITVAGNVKVTPFSPFAPTAAYDASVNGGSGYFDTTDDCLTGNVSLSSSTSMNTFTVEGWIYPTNFSSILRVIGDLILVNPFYAVLWVELNTSGQVTLNWYDGAGKSAISTNAMQANAWNWFAVVVNAGAINIYVNSTTAGQTGTTTLTNRTQNTTWTVGRFASQTKPAAYFSNLRWSNGVARTISEIPTAPYTSDSDVRLLLNFTNAGIFDNTGKNNLETVGNAQIDTTTKKYGTGSMEFDGTGDYLKAVSNPQFILSGDFTIEAWVYPNSTAANFVVICLGDSYTSTGLELYAGSAVLDWRVYSADASKIDSSTAYASGAWVHLAVVRSSGVMTLYVNGTAEGSTWSTTATFSGNLLVGGELYNGTLSSPTNGFIDDLRITKGVARYTTTFTPPTKAFPDL